MVEADIKGWGYLPPVEQGWYWWRAFPHTRPLVIEYVTRIKYVGGLWGPRVPDPPPMEIDDVDPEG